ncbi:MAG: hypothetical protein M3Y82_04230 [Verrucomicrobiota bacterium]|nr:hypothetical protein [Verrucomicrobiota bacterium]
MQLLNASKVKYLLIGGYAVGYYGYPRATGDMDIWIAAKKANAEKLVTVLREFGFCVPELSAELFLQPDRIIRLGIPPIRIEIHTGISGVSFNECYSQCVLDKIDAIEIRVINLSDLKINKKASGRLKDLNDLENLPE